MNRRSLILILSILGLWLAALAPLASAEADPEALQYRLGQLEQRLIAPGTGLLPQARHSIVRLEDLMKRGEYRQFNKYVTNEIIGPWRQVDGPTVVQLADAPPQQLSGSQRVLLKRNRLLVKQINAKLRRLRRLLTRVEKLRDESHRRLVEVERARGQYERLLGDLERIDPPAAALRREWLDTQFRSRRDRLQDRRRLMTESLERLLHWSEDPTLRGMLRELSRVNRALEHLQKHYRAQYFR